MVYAQFLSICETGIPKLYQKLEGFFSVEPLKWWSRLFAGFFLILNSQNPLINTVYLKLDSNL